MKKNGRVLRRLTGQPPWSSLVGTMEVADGSKFGMPGDDERAWPRRVEGGWPSRICNVVGLYRTRWNAPIERNATFTGGVGRLLKLRETGDGIGPTWRRFGGATQRDVRVGPCRSATEAAGRLARRRRVEFSPSFSSYGAEAFGRAGSTRATSSP